MSALLQELGRPRPSRGAGGRARSGWRSAGHRGRAGRRRRRDHGHGHRPDLVRRRATRSPRPMTMPSGRPISVAMIVTTVACQATVRRTCAGDEAQDLQDREVGASGADRCQQEVHQRADRQQPQEAPDHERQVVDPAEVDEVDRLQRGCHQDRARASRPRGRAGRSSRPCRRRGGSGRGSCRVTALPVVSTAWSVFVVTYAPCPSPIVSDIVGNTPVPTTVTGTDVVTPDMPGGPGHRAAGAGVAGRGCRAPPRRGRSRDGPR